MVRLPSLWFIYASQGPGRCVRKWAQGGSETRKEVDELGEALVLPPGPGAARPPRAVSSFSGLLGPCREGWASLSAASTVLFFKVGKVRRGTWCIFSRGGCGSPAPEPSQASVYIGSGRVTVYCVNFLKQYCAFTSCKHLYRCTSWRFPRIYTFQMLR